MRPAISILTPTHDPRFLRELAFSISQQTFSDFEWVIVVNGRCTVDNVLNALVDAPPLLRSRVRCLTSSPSTPKSIGGWKREAFMAAQAEILVEADHDDLLAPECLERIHEAFKTRGADFAYSNMAAFVQGSVAKLPLWREFVPEAKDDSRDDETFLLDPSFYSPGSKTRPARVFGRDWNQCVVTPISPHFFFKCINGPIHVRAWKRNLYLSLGGHDPAYTVMDDMDLVVRTYLAGAKFVHLDECLYLYRGTGANTSTTAGPLLVQDEYNRYYSDDRLKKVLKRWTEDNGLLGADSLSLAASTPQRLGYLWLEAEELTLTASPADVLSWAHAKLVHGGWLVINGPSSWNHEDVLRFTRPRRAPKDLKERYQELHVEWIHDLRSVGTTTIPGARRHLKIHVAAKQTDEPLPGYDHWTPRLTLTALLSIKRTFLALGAEAHVTRDGIVEASGGGPLAKQAADLMIPQMEGMLRYTAEKVPA